MKHSRLCSERHNRIIAQQRMLAPQRFEYCNLPEILVALRHRLMKRQDLNSSPWYAYTALAWHRRKRCAECGICTGRGVTSFGEGRGCAERLTEGAGVLVAEIAEENNGTEL